MAVSLVDFHESEDCFGRDCMLFNTVDLRKIHDKLWGNFGGEGYKFVIVLDGCSIDEYEEFKKPVNVYFMDSILEEMIAYCDKKSVKDALIDMGWIDENGVWR